MQTKLFFKKINDQRLCFSIKEKSEDKKTITLIFPHLVLPFGYVSVDLVKTLTGINVKEEGTDRILMGLDHKSLDAAEELWPSFLLLASLAYVEGYQDEINSYARNVAAMC